MQNNMQKYAKNILNMQVSMLMHILQRCALRIVLMGLLPPGRWTWTVPSDQAKSPTLLAGRPGHTSAGPARTTVIDRCQVSVAVSSLELLWSKSSLSESPSQAAGCHWQCHAETWSCFGMGWPRRTASESLPALSGLRPPWLWLGLRRLAGLTEVPQAGPAGDGPSGQRLGRRALLSPGPRQ